MNKQSVKLKIVGLATAVLSILSYGTISAQKSNLPIKTTLKPAPKPALTAAETALEKGKAFLADDLYAEAIIEFNQAIRLDPKLTEAFIQRAVAHGQRGDSALSREDALQAIRLNPNGARAYNILGKTYEQEKQFDAAISSYGKAVELDPKYVAAYNNRGLVFAAAGMFDDAIKDFTAIIRLDPGNAYAYYENRGIVYGLKKEYKKAIDDFTQTIKIKPRRIKAYRLRIVAYRNIGNTEAAETDEDTIQNLETAKN